jgi:hypothetical protein
MGRACSTNIREMHIGYWWERQKRPLGRPRSKWANNIKMGLWMVWYGLGPVEGACEHGNATIGSHKMLGCS